MKAIQYFGKEQGLKLLQVEKPEISDDEALIKVEYIGICGSDIERINSSNWNADQLPVIPSHEIIGRVIEIKARNKNLINTRVAVEPTVSCDNCIMCKMNFNHICNNRKLIGVHINGGMAEFIKVKFKKLYLIPYTISIKNAILVEPISIGPIASYKKVLERLFVASCNNLYEANIE